MTIETDRQALAQGAIRFGLVSILAYAIWAFGGRMSETVLYSAITLAFLGLSGVFLYPLLKGDSRLGRTYLVFIPGFLLYAILWCVGWFGIGGNAGEIFGSAAGLAALTFWMQKMLRGAGFLTVFAVLFLFHTLGYTLGGLCYYSSGGRGILAPILEGQKSLGRLLWGLFHGLGFGAGLGFAFHRFQRN